MADPVVPSQVAPAAPAPVSEPAPVDSGEISHEDLSALAGESEPSQGGEVKTAEQNVADAEKNLKNAKTAQEKDQAKKKLE